MIELNTGAVVHNEAKGKKILFIEDDTFLRKIIAEKLTKHSFVVEEAGDGNTAFQKLKSFEPELILLDLILPDMNGFEILKILKSDSHYSRIPVVVLSNLGQKEDIERTKTLGAVGFFIKVDFIPEDLVSEIEKLLGL